MRKFQIGQTIMVHDVEKLTPDEEIEYEKGDVVVIHSVEECRVAKFCKKQCSKVFINGYCGYRFNSYRIEKLKRIL